MGAAEKKGKNGGIETLGKKRPDVSGDTIKFDWTRDCGEELIPKLTGALGMKPALEVKSKFDRGTSVVSNLDGAVTVIDWLWSTPAELDSTLCGAD